MAEHQTDVITWNNAGINYWGIYASLSLDKLWNIRRYFVKSQSVTWPDPDTIPMASARKTW